MSMPVISSDALLALSRISRSLVLTRDGVLDLDTRVDFDKVVTVLSIDEELRRTGVAVADALRELDRVGEDGLADVFGEVRRRCDLDDLLVPALN
jgi:hypothetical protein